MKNKQKISVAGLCFTYAGCFLGAGYVSGQELWQFFGAYGIKGYFGVALSMLLFFIFGTLLLRTVQLSGKDSIDEVILPGNHPILQKVFSGIILFFMFGIFVIMSAGAGALINQVFCLPRVLGCALFCIGLCIAAMYGISGAVRVFTVLVPVLVFTTLIICIAALNKYGITISHNTSGTNSLLGSWWLSAITYVSFNMIASVGTIVPMGSFIKRRRTVYFGIMLSCVLMLAFATGIIMTITTMSASVETELPMLDVAFKMSDVVGYIYSALLLIGMFGTSLASIVAIIEYADRKIPTVKSKNKLLIFAIGILGFFFSLAGFGTLVGTVYPIFGYIGFAVLFFIISNFLYYKLKAK